VVLDGVVTVRTIAAFRSTLLNALTEHRSVRVDCSAAESVDLSLIQLLLSARLSAHRQGKRLKLAAPADGVLRATLEQGGFMPPSGADPFWSGGP
jgi:anti-anti-sigma regulatory factor